MCTLHSVQLRTQQVLPIDWCGCIGQEPNMKYAWLAAAIVCEVFATSALKASDGFSRPLPSAIVFIGYAAAFFFLSQTLKSVPVGIAYAIWSGVGTILIALLGRLVYKQTLNAPTILGMALIIVGAFIMNVFSGSSAH